jgi:Fe-S cluster assembly iron-binding protein IscA
MTAMMKHVIGECRQRVHRSRSRLRSWLGIAARVPAVGPRDDVPEAIWPHYQLLLDSGIVVWGCTAQANRLLYEPGDEDNPGNTVYSPSPYFDDNPQHLADITNRVRQLKGSEPNDPELAAVAAAITDPYNQIDKQLLPYKLTDGHEVYFAWTLIHRGRLPDGVLSDRMLPLMICPERTPGTMIPPLAFWARPLIDRWGRLVEWMQQFPSQRQVVRPAKPGKVPRLEPETEDQAHGLVRITPEAARTFRRVAKETIPNGPAFLALSVIETEFGRGHKCDLAPSWDRERELCVESRGIKILVPRDQAALLRGTVVDFRSSIFGTGFKIRNPNLDGLD